MRGMKTSEASLGSKALIYSRAKSKNLSKPKTVFKGYDNPRSSAKPKRTHENMSTKV
jgi:hypothetical protein